ncbi:hypothetical protein QO011_005699 [Labrys wisconsinensis]|uniref:Uncharacterized protein n=1 Tax=Labrys wisconsinensis TaxID=425677 RepID=A0ABU0JEG4_9HYPH|nr:hypothetical protein [Labrys wisconsinensis]
MLRKTIKLLHSVENIVFIISNTQNNLSGLSREIEGLNLRIHERDVEEIIGVVGRYFDAECRFLFITNPDIGHVPQVVGNSRGYIIEHNTETWHGNTAAWQFIIRQFFGYYDDIADSRAMDRLDYLVEQHEGLRRQHASLRRRHRALRERLNDSASTPRQAAERPPDQLPVAATALRRVKSAIEGLRWKERPKVAMTAGGEWSASLEWDGETGDAPSNGSQG